MSRLPKLGILGSGSGSNCQSIYDAIQSGSLRAEIAVVMSDNPDAFILERARSWGIPAEVIPIAEVWDTRQSHMERQEMIMVYLTSPAARRA